MCKLVIFVEGDEDKLFFEYVLTPLFTKKHICILVIPYQKKANKKVKKSLSMHRNNYIFLSDLDSHSFPCITSRKHRRADEYVSLDINKIIIVKEEIESWYLAGLNNSSDEFNNIKVPSTTENVTKEEFECIMNETGFSIKRDFLIEICKTFDFNCAINRNSSFEYFLRKMGLIDYI